MCPIGPIICPIICCSGIICPICCMGICCPMYCWVMKLELLGLMAMC